MYYLLLNIDSVCVCTPILSVPVHFYMHAFSSEDAAMTHFNETQPQRDGLSQLDLFPGNFSFQPAGNMDEQAKKGWQLGNLKLHPAMVSSTSVQNGSIQAFLLRLACSRLFCCLYVLFDQEY